VERGTLENHKKIKPLPNPSIKSRFSISLSSNIFRGVISIATGLMIARGLGPENYGDFVFLLGCFIASRQLLDLGTSQAFYTFMCQKPRGRMFVASYAGWQLVQFLLPMLFLSLLIPTEWIERIWVGQDKASIILAFAAVYMRQNAWQMMVQIGESARLTHRIQLINLAIAAMHFLLVIWIWQVKLFSVKILLGLIVLEYLVALVISYRFFFVRKLEDHPFDWKLVFREYRIYCVPLVIISLIGFVYEFADRWLLQSFGGSQEQGFYGIAYQLATVSMLATISILNIFWKEISEAHEKHNMERVSMLFRKVSRSLFVVAAFLSGFFIPWVDDIVRLCLGSDYMKGASAISVMLFYPLYQSLGQINGVMLLATGKTKIQLVHGGIFMTLSLPLSYWVLAPEEALIPGLALGSTGIAFKMVILQISNANFLIWWISREFKWKFEWEYQIAGMIGGVGAGWIAFEIVQWADSVLMMNLPVRIGFALILDAVMMGMFIWFLPWVAGLTRNEIKTLFIQALHFFRK